MKRTLIHEGVGFKTREENGEKHIEGYFAVFDGKYWLWDDC